METSSTRGTMAALALPISELTPVVYDAKERTKCVVMFSKAAANFTVTYQIATKTFALRGRLSHLVTIQAKLLENLVNHDYNVAPAGKVLDIATSIDKLVADERELLCYVDKLGSEIRVWWKSSVTTLTRQVEHLELIADSLHVACDDTASTLLATAVEQFANQGVEQFAME